MHFKNYSKIESTRHLKPGKDSPPAMLSQSFFKRLNVYQGLLTFVSTFTKVLCEKPLMF